MALALTTGEQRIAVGAALTTAWVAILPPAPVRFSTHERLTEMLRQPLPDQASHQFRRAAAAQTFEDAHRSGRIILRISDARRCRRNRGHAGKAQKISTLQLHLGTAGQVSAQRHYRRAASQTPAHSESLPCSHRCEKRCSGAPKMPWN